MSEQLMAHVEHIWQHMEKVTAVSMIYLGQYKHGRKPCLSKGEHIGTVMMDLSKAFDTWSHALLIHIMAKLKAHIPSDTAGKMVNVTC